MEEIDVPCDFLCPISMELMSDPVTISTGMTYDRESIENWLFTCKNNTCPITKQIISCDSDPIPNHALRRLIQSWCTLNASYGIKRIPTPKPPIDKTQITKLLDNAKRSSKMQQKCLQKLRSITYGPERNKRFLENVGALDFLASLIARGESNVVEVATDNGTEFRKASEEALFLLSNLDIPDTSRNNLMNNIAFLESLMNVLRYGNLRSRTNAIILMKTLFEADGQSHLLSTRQVLYDEIARILGDKISLQALKAALKLLIQICPWGRNRIKAVESGLVSVLVELILESTDRRVSELIMVLLNQLCAYAEGRAELLSHGAGLAVVSKKILRVSSVATDRAVRVLWSISKFSASSRVLQDMLQVGVVSKLCLLLQMDTNVRVKERAKEILLMHSRVWRNSKCIPPRLFSSYPSS